MGVKQDGVAEDFSAKKCLDAIELNPPYVKSETPKENKEGEKGQAVSEAAASATGTATADQPSKVTEAKAGECEAEPCKEPEAEPSKEVEAKTDESKPTPDVAGA